MHTNTHTDLHRAQHGSSVLVGYQLANLGDDGRPKWTSASIPVSSYAEMLQLMQHAADPEFEVRLAIREAASIVQKRGTRTRRKSAEICKLARSLLLPAR